MIEDQVVTLESGRGARSPREGELLEEKNIPPVHPNHGSWGRRQDQHRGACQPASAGASHLAGWVPADHPARSSFLLDLCSRGESSAQPELQALGLSAPQLMDRDMLSLAAPSLARRLGFLQRRVALPDWARRR